MVRRPRYGMNLASHTKNFTLYTKRWTSGMEGYHPFWECNDPTGQCKGQYKRLAAIFPAGYEVEDKNNIIGHYKDGTPIYGTKFVYDENCGPMYNGEHITECPYCN